MMEPQTIFLSTSVAREKLIARRSKLETARAGLPNPDHLSRLLREVDAALEKIANDTYGLCEACHEPIEPDRLTADPLRIAALAVGYVRRVRALRPPCTTCASSVGLGPYLTQ